MVPESCVSPRKSAGMDVADRDVFKKSKKIEKYFLENFLELLKVGEVWGKSRNPKDFRTVFPWVCSRSCPKPVKFLKNQQKFIVK